MQKVDKKLSKSSQKLSKVQNSTVSSVGNSSFQAFGISFADRPKAKSELYEEELEEEEEEEEDWYSLDQVPTTSHLVKT
jgi:hypothetical protein